MTSPGEGNAVTPLWRWPDLQEQFNRRQMNGQPCDDLIDLMLREISPRKETPHEQQDTSRSHLRSRA